MSKAHRKEACMLDVRICGQTENVETMVQGKMSKFVCAENH